MIPMIPIPIIIPSNVSHDEKKSELAKALVAIAQIAAFSHKSIYEAESFMSEVARFALSGGAKSWSEEWTTDEWLKQIEMRFRVKYHPKFEVRG